MTYTDSLNLLLVLNGLGAIGRVVLNTIAGHVGPVNMFVPTALIAGLCVIGWIGVGSPAGMYGWSVVYGIVGGALQSLFPAGLTSLTTDLQKAGVRMGMVFTINSFSVLTGPPISGAILTATGGRYYGAQAFAGTALLVGTGFIFAARMALAKKSGGGWAARV